MTVDVSFPNTTTLLLAIAAAGMSTVEIDAMVIRSAASLCGLLYLSFPPRVTCMQSKGEVSYEMETVDVM